MTPFRLLVAQEPEQSFSKCFYFDVGGGCMGEFALLKFMEMNLNLLNLYTFLHECNTSVRTFVLKMDTVFHLVSSLWDLSRWKAVKKTLGLVAQDTTLLSRAPWEQTIHTERPAWGLSAGHCGATGPPSPSTALLPF